MAAAKICDACGRFVDPRTDAAAGWLRLDPADDTSKDFCGPRCVVLWLAAQEAAWQRGPGSPLRLVTTGVKGLTVTLFYARRLQAEVRWDDLETPDCPAAPLDSRQRPVL
jgi:hypothetical protein